MPYSTLIDRQGQRSRVHPGATGDSENHRTDSGGITFDSTSLASTALVAFTHAIVFGFDVFEFVEHPPVSLIIDTSPITESRIVPFRTTNFENIYLLIHWYKIYKIH